METKKYRLGPATRLEIGAVVLEGALQVDTKLIKPCLNAFTTVQRRYAGAQNKVETLDVRLGQLQTQLAHRDSEQDNAVEALACALATDGQPRANPFDAFGAAAPSLLKKLPCAEKAAAIDQLVAAVHRSKWVSQPSRDAAQAAQTAARAMEAALAQTQVLETRLQNARNRRDAIGEKWDKQLAALKRRTRSAADEGGTDLHPALFGRLVPVKSKKKPAVVTGAPEAPATSTA